jgi:hypothetical protein
VLLHMIRRRRLPDADRMHGLLTAPARTG